MKKSLSPIYTTFGLLVFLLISTFSYTKAQSPSVSSLVVSVQHDSLTYSTQSPILYNTVSLTNTSSKDISVGVNSDIPNGWRQMGNSTTAPIVIKPGETGKVAVNLVKTPNASADWTPVTIKISQNRDTSAYMYVVRTEAVHNYIAYSVIDNIELSERPDDIHMEVYLKNTGNVTENFQLQWENKKFLLNDKETIRLKPGQDTLYKYKVNVNNTVWRELYKETISLSLKNEAGKNFANTYNISKERNSVKENKSAYSTIPLSIGGGSFIYGKNVNYYGFINGQISFAPQHNLTFSYTSKPYGSNLWGFQRDILMVDYNYKKWHVSLGQLNIPPYFIVVGNGVGISYKEENSEFGIRGVLHDPRVRYPANDNYSAYARYKVGKLNVSQDVVANFDPLTKINSYLIDNKVDIIATKSVSLNVDGGIGVEEKTKEINSNIPKATVGYRAGYSFSLNKKYWFFNSSLKYANTYFPGMFQGTLYQLHSINRRFGNLTTGLFISSSNISRNYYIDTNYNTKKLTNGYSRYGIRNSYITKNTNTNLSFGLQQSVGAGSLYGVGKSIFFDFNHMYRLGTYTSFSILSTSAYSNNFGEDKQDIISSSASASFNTKYGGVMGSYNSMPILSYDGERVEKNIQFISGGPFVSYGLFNRRLTGNVNYTMSKSSEDEIVRSNVGAGLSYNNQRAGLSMQANVFMPVVTDPSNTSILGNSRSGRVTIRKDFNIPLITSKRKYYDLKLVLYEDKNNNGKLDDNEKKLDNAHVNIGDEYLVSNNKGEIKYRNIESKAYRVDMLGIKTEDDLIPVEGPVQSVVVDKHTIVEVPFKKGKLITGHVNVLLDSFSNVTFTPDYVKVTATDTTGRTYTTLTDSKGDFYFVVPAGIFSLSLNPSAFAGTAFKPLRTAYDIDLMNNEESIVTFEIEQKKRKVRFLQASAAEEQTGSQ